MQTNINKIYYFFIVSALILLSTSTHNCLAQNSVTAARNVIWENKLQHQLSFYTDDMCEGRATGTRGNTEAAFNIIRIFEKAKVLPFNGTYAKRFFLGDGKIGRNIIGMIPGSNENPSDKYIIIGAHFDNLGAFDGKIYPGADANASGIVAMTSLAEMIAAKKYLGRSYPYNFIFVAFDANKLDLAGSKALWNMIEFGRLKDPITGKRINPENIKLMVNLEQIGGTSATLSSKREDYIIMLGKNSLPSHRQNRLSDINRYYNIGLELSYTYYGSDRFTEIFYNLSDQKVFIENKIPSVLFTSGITMTTNKRNDLPNTINYEVLKKRIYLIFHWIENIL